MCTIYTFPLKSQWQFTYHFQHSFSTCSHGQDDYNHASVSNFKGLLWNTCYENYFILRCKIYFIQQVAGNIPRGLWSTLTHSRILKVLYCDRSREAAVLSCFQQLAKDPQVFKHHSLDNKGPKTWRKYPHYTTNLRVNNWYKALTSDINEASSPREMLLSGCFLFFRPLSAHVRDGCVEKAQQISRFAVDHIWHQPLYCIQSHNLMFPDPPWTQHPEKSNKTRFSFFSFRNKKTEIC